MRRRIILAFAAVAIACLYLFALTYAIGVAAALPTPSWGLGLISNRAYSTLMWLHLFHAVAVALVSLPFAYVISVAYCRFGVWLALATTIAICSVIQIPSLIEFFEKAGATLRAIWVLDTIELVGLLPMFVWMLRRLPSNYRLERP